jgi:hypothetical protein
MEGLVVASKLKALGKGAKLRVSSEFIKALSKLVFSVVVASAKTCKESGMTTIKERHMTVPSDD